MADVLQQIMSDYHFEQEKQKMRQAEAEDEAERERLLATKQAKEEEQAQKSTETRQIDPETGEILDGGQLYQNELDALRVAENEPKRYTQKMTLEVYFTNAAEKDLFKAGLAELGFEHKQTSYLIHLVYAIDCGYLCISGSCTLQHQPCRTLCE